MRMKTLLMMCVATMFAGWSAVSAEVALPQNYTPLAWVASDGHQRLDTGVPITSTLQAELDLVLLQYTGDIVLGCQEGAFVHAWRFFCTPDGSYFDCGGTDAAQNRIGVLSNAKLNFDTRYVVRCGCEGANFYLRIADQTTGALLAESEKAFAGSLDPNSLKAGDGWQKIFGLKIYDFAEPNATERSCVRDLVPCRSPSGEAGLWDKTTGAFFGSIGTDEFFGSDEEGRFLASLTAATAGAFIDTGVRPTWSLQAELDFTPLATTGDISVGLYGPTASGADVNAWRLFNHANGFYFDCGGAGATLCRIGPKDKLTNIRSLMSFGCDDTNVYAQFVNVKTGVASERYTTNLGNTTFAEGTIGVFGGNKAKIIPFAMTLYSLKFKDKNGDGERVYTHDFLPYRSVDGKFGVYDRKTNEFISNSGTAGFTECGYGYNPDGTGLKVYNGTFNSQDDSFGEATAIEKVSRHFFAFNGPVPTMPSFTVSEGTVSFVDGFSRTATVSGPLTLKGGTRLVFDVLPTDNDSLTASSVTLAQADANAPIVIEVCNYGCTISSVRTLVAGGALTAVDLEKFVLKSVSPAHLDVQEGNLVFVPDAAPPEAELPAGYRRLGFVESTLTQWIDTGYYPFCEAVADITVSFPVLPAEGAQVSYFGQRYASSHESQFGAWIKTTGGKTFHYAAVGKTESLTTIPVAVDTPYRVHLEKNGACFIDGVYFNAGMSGRAGSIYSAYLFSMDYRNGFNSPSCSRIHDCRLWTKTPTGLRLDRDFVPAQRESDGEIGLYERVNGKFYTRTGGATFGAGLPAAITGADYAQTTTGCTTVDGVELTGTLTWTAGTLAVAETASQKIRCGALQLAGGTLAFATLGEGTPEIQVFGAATVTGPVTVTLPPALAEGTYDLITAQTFSLSGGSFALAEGCAVGNDGATRRLETSETGIKLVVGAQAMPAGYERLAYIRSTGKQFLDTHTDVWELSSVDFRFCGLSEVSHRALFGLDLWKNSRFMFDAQGDVVYFHGPDVPAKFDRPSVEAECRLLVGADTYVRLTRSDLERTDVCHSQMTFDGTDRSLAIFSVKGDYTHASTYTFREMRVAYHGNLLRYLVPCRNPEGEVGLWDFVEGRFFGNEGEGKFLAPSDIGPTARLNYAQSNGKQRLLTDYAMDENTVMKFSFGHPVYVPSTVFVGLVWGNYNYLFNQQNNAFYFHDTGKVFSLGLPDANARYTLEVGDDNWATLKKEGSSAVHSIEVSRAVTGASNTNLSVFDANGGSHGSTYRFYSLELGKASGDDVRTVTWDARFVPYRSTYGQVGLLDEKTGKFYECNESVSNAGDFLTYGYAYNLSDNGVVVYDGVVEIEDAFAPTNVRKEGLGTIQMGVVSDYTSLDIAEGCFSLRDGTARMSTVSGTLALAGGTRLLFDVLPGGYDRLVAQAVNLENASAENPVVVFIEPTGWGTFTETGTLELIHGNLSTADLDKFVVEGFEATLSVVNGTLVATFPPALPMMARWTGAGDRTRVNDPANWTCFNAAGQQIVDALPTNVTTVVFGPTTDFNFPAGQTLLFRDLQLEQSEVTLTADCDWRGLPVPIDFNVKLAGHALTLASFASTGTIRDGIYQKLEYIRSTGTQWINTGVMASSGLQAELDFIPHEHTGDINVGVDVVHATAWRFFDYSGGVLFDYGDKNRCGKTTATPLTLGTRYVAQFGREGDYAYNRVYVKSTDTLYANYQTNATSTIAAETIGVFGGIGGGTDTPTMKYAKMSLYSLKLTDLVNGTRKVVRDFVPARRYDTGVVGLLDQANNVFYPNNGTGEFTAGPALADNEVLGSVVVDVPAGEQLNWENAGVNLEGQMYLVKKGAGSLAMKHDNAGHAGGTEVFGGKLLVTDNGAATHRLGAVGSTLTVHEDAVLDLASYYDFSDYQFTLDGGEIIQSGYIASPASKTLITHLNVETNSVMTFKNSSGFIAPDSGPTLIDLRGHELEINIDSTTAGVYFGNTTVTRGKLVLRGRWFEGYKCQVLDFSAATLEVHGNFAMNQNCKRVDLGDYIVCTTAEEDGEGNDSKYKSPVFVHGTFKPVTPYFTGFTLLNGAKIDLSETQGTLNVVSETKRTRVDHTLIFEANAQIGIVLGDRRIRNNEKIIAWPEKTAVTAEFTAVKRSDVILEKREDGLYCISNGTILFFR